MDATDFSYKLTAFHHHITGLSQQLAQRTAPLTLPLHDILEDLKAALEEVQVAEEMRHEQHEKLAAAYRTIEAERQRYQALFEFAPDGYLVTTLDGTITEANRTAADLLAMRQDRLPGKPLAVFVPREARSTFRAHLGEAARASGSPQHWELWLQPRHQAPLYAALSVAPLHDYHGVVQGLQWSIRDITVRQQLLVALQASEAQFRALANAIPAIVWTAAPDGTITFANDQWFHFCGLTPEQNAQHWLELVLHADDRERCMAQWTEALARGTAYEIEVRNRRYDGVYRWFLTRAVPMRDPESRITGWFGTTTDINDRKLLEERLQQSEERLQLALTAANAAYWEWDFQTNTTTWFTRGRRLLGLVNDQETLSYDTWCQHIHPDDASRFAGAITQAIAQQRDLEVEYRVVWPDGSLHWLQNRGQVIVSPEQRPLRMLGLVMDITERKRTEEALQNLTNTLAQQVIARTAELSQANATLQAEMRQHQQAKEELEQQQATLAHREQLAAMGSLLASVAHELNNPLSVVMMQADILGEEAGESPLRGHITELTQAARQCVEIVHHFLSLARKQPPQHTQVALNTVVETAMKLLAYPLQVDSIVVEHSLADDLPVLWADPHQLQQVVVNLITNAHQALREAPGRRQLTITTRAEQSPQRLILEIADTGPGIPPAIRQRIFEPFFTTRPPGVGTGLGLPLCLGIVEGHGGTLRVDSVPGQGTVVGVELPMGAMPVTLPASEPSGLSATTPKTILVVDDDPGIARALAYFLRRDGHTVETAADGYVALAKCQNQDYDVILCDLRMPALDGPGLYQELRRHHPHLCARMVFLTGDTFSPAAQAFLEEVGAPRLAKPFTAAMVRQTIQGS